MRRIKKQTMTSSIRNTLRINVTLLFSFILFGINHFVLAQPANDNPCSAIQLSVGTSPSYSTYNNTNATISTGIQAPGCTSFTNTDILDVWFSVVVPSSGVLFVSTIAGSLTDSGMAIYTGACSSLTKVFCDDNSAQGASNMSFLAKSTYTPGSTVWIRIWGKAQATGDFGVCAFTHANLPNPGSNLPAGDECSTAPNICNFQGYIGNTSTTAYTVTNWPEYVSAYSPNSINGDSFISFIAQQSTITFTIWQTSSNYGYGFQYMLFTAATCGSGPVTKILQYQNANNFYLTPITITANVTPGNTYYLAMDGYAGDNCEYIIGLPPDGGGFAIGTNVNPSLSTVCTNTPIQIEATGGGIGTTYSWSTLPANTSDLSATTGNIVTITSSIAGQKTYTVTSSVSNSACPDLSADAIITFIDPPTVANITSPSSSICSGSTLQLSNSTLNGVWTSDTPLIASVSSSGLVTAITSGTAIIRYSVTIGCGDYKTISISVNPNVSFTVSQGQLLDNCLSPNGALNFIGLSSSSAYTLVYNVNNTPISSSISFTTDVNGSFTLSNLNAGEFSNFIISSLSSGCIGSDVGVFNFTYPPITFLASSIPPIDCTSNNGMISLSGLSSNTTFSCTYNFGGNAYSSPIITDATGNYNIPNLTAGNYTNFIVTLGANCSGYFSNTITITNPIVPVVNLSASDICSGQSATIFTDVDPAGTFAWSTNETTSTIIVSPTISTQYSLIYTSISGCSSIPTFITLQVYDPPLINITSDISIAGCLPLNVVFKITVEANSNTGTINFGDGITLPFSSGTIFYPHTYTISGSKDLTLIFSNPGCSTTLIKPKMIDVLPKVNALISVDKVTSSITDPTFAFTSNSTNSNTYKWYFGDDSTSIDSTLIHNYLPISGERFVKLVASKNGMCSDSTILKITITEDLIYYIPNAFTPNGDFTNPSFQPVFTSGFDPSHYSFIIMDRWGEIVCHTNNYNDGWDGTYKGYNASIGTYIWSVEFKDKVSDKIYSESGFLNIIH